MTRREQESWDSGYRHGYHNRPDANEKIRHPDLQDSFNQGFLRGQIDREKHDYKTKAKRKAQATA